MWFWLFVLSSSLNIFLFFYIRWLLKTIEVMNEDVSSILLLTQDFSNHLVSVNELEMFYGDETLQSLMTHASTLSEKLKNLDLIINEEEEILEEEKEED